MNHTFLIVAIGCTILGIVSGGIGCFAVIRKQSLLGDMISHSSLAGICLAYLIFKRKEIEILLLGAFLTGVVCIGIIHLIQKYTKIKYDSVLAFLLSIFFGFGLVLLSYLNKLPGANKAGLNKFIFGQAATLTKKDVKIIIIVGIILLSVIILFWKEFKVVSFDSEFAKTMGFSSKLIDLIISSLIIFIVIVGIQVAGLVLIIAMTISPAVAARQWSDKLFINFVLSGIFGGISGLTGTLISITEQNLPTGPLIVIILSLIVLFSLVFSHKKGIVIKIIKNQKNKKEIRKKLIILENNGRK